MWIDKNSIPGRAKPKRSTLDGVCRRQRNDTSKLWDWFSTPRLDLENQTAATVSGEPLRPKS